MTATERAPAFAGVDFCAAHAGPVPGAAGVRAGGGKYPGGDDPALVGLAMGIYGLTQGLLQIPFGLASDRWGRKRVIIAGLVVFAPAAYRGLGARLTG
jgi:MFS family permease